jgi:magnesium transporter
MTAEQDILTEDGADQHPPETAGRLMTESIARAIPGDTVGDVNQRIARDRPELADPVLAVDADGRLRGVIRLGQLAGADPGQAADTLVDTEWPSVPPDMDQERVGALARSKALVAVPVVAEDGCVLGAVGAVRLLDVLWREHTEDVHRLAGIMKPLHEASFALQEPPMHRAWRRLPWLLVGFAGTAVATALMASFEAMFEANVKVAFFVPAIVYLADAIGAQTVAVAVRGLPIAHRPFWQLFSGEAATGVIIGTVLALLAYAAVALGFGDPPLAAAVAIAILVAGAVATAVGLALPWLLVRLGLDPAFGSGPVATIIQDILSILVYVLAVAAILT